MHDTYWRLLVASALLLLLPLQQLHSGAGTSESAAAAFAAPHMQFLQKVASFADMCAITKTWAGGSAAPSSWTTWPFMLCAVQALAAAILQILANLAHIFMPRMRGLSETDAAGCQRGVQAQHGATR